MALHKILRVTKKIWGVSELFLKDPNLLRPTTERKWRFAETTDTKEMIKTACVYIRYFLITSDDEAERRKPALKIRLNKQRRHLPVIRIEQAQHQFHLSRNAKLYKNMFSYRLTAKIPLLLLYFSSFYVYFNLRRRFCYIHLIATRVPIYQWKFMLKKKKNIFFRWCIGKRIKRFFSLL